MIKHGASHGFSVLGCTIIAAFIVEMLKPLLPNLIKRFSEFSTPIIEKFHLPISVEFFNVLLLATILAVLWGMFFKRRIVR